MIRRFVSHDSRHLGSRYGVLMIIGLLYAAISILGVQFERKLLADDYEKRLLDVATRTEKHKLDRRLHQGPTETLKKEVRSATFESEKEEIAFYEKIVDWAFLDQTKKYFFAADTNEAEQRFSAQSDTVVKAPLSTDYVISSGTPVFVLGLPNSGSLAVQRYFECSGLSVGRNWVKNKRTGKPIQIGKCMHQAMNNMAKNITGVTMRNCGNFDVWTDMHYVETPSPNQPFPKCFLPTLYADALETLYQAYPQATVLQVTKSPKEWFKTLSEDVKLQWTLYCNANHGNNLPSIHDAPPEDYEDFYIWHQQQVEHFVTKHPKWKLVKVALDQTPEQNSNDSHQVVETGLMLEQELGIESKCWVNAVSDIIPDKLLSTNGSELDEAKHRPNDILYPIMVTSLPKSGTQEAEKYFRCGLGRRAVASHYVTKSRRVEGDVPIGECMKTNMDKGGRIFAGCGESTTQVFSDVGVIRHKRINGKKPICFYPEMQGGLDAFAKMYPRGTLVHVVTDPKAWYEAVSKYHNLAERWSDGCPNLFPAPKSPSSEWESFYRNHTEIVREFARGHPTLTYVEVSLNSSHTPNQLHDFFGFPIDCW